MEICGIYPVIDISDTINNRHNWKIPNVDIL